MAVEAMGFFIVMKEAWWFSWFEGNSHYDFFCKLLTGVEKPDQAMNCIYLAADEKE